MPALESKIVHLYGGRYHYTALLENGNLVSWGNNKYGQIDVPAKGAERGQHRKNLRFQLPEPRAGQRRHDVLPGGSRGFVLGTDSLGRDMLTRIVNGGQVTMTVGAISVVIATILGIIFGASPVTSAGRIEYPHHAYRGDRRRPAVHPVRDDPLRRHRHSSDPTQRMYLIMVVLAC